MQLLLRIILNAWQKSASRQVKTRLAVCVPFESVSRLHGYQENRTTSKGKGHSASRDDVLTIRIIVSVIGRIALTQDILSSLQIHFRGTARGDQRDFRKANAKNTSKRARRFMKQSNWSSNHLSRSRQSKQRVKRTPSARPIRTLYCLRPLRPFCLILRMEQIHA